MGSGWRRAFCTTIPRHKDKSNPKPDPNPNSTSNTKLNTNTSSTLRCRTFPDQNPNPNPNPNLQCNAKSPGIKFGSNPSSPRSPFSILKTTLRLTRNGCGVCMQSVKRGQGRAIYTAECSHAFHFPCISTHVTKHGTLICPVCNRTWKDVSLLNILKNNQIKFNFDDILTTLDTKTPLPPSSSAPATPTGTTRVHFEDKRIQSIKTRSPSSLYNDDEPLLVSPRFDPILEEEKEDEEEEDEFQGFFPTPKMPVEPVRTKKNEFQGFFPTPKMPVEPVRTKKNPNVEVKLLPEAAVVSTSRSYETYAVALRVKAPPVSAVVNHRAPVDLVTVLDVSGSMNGMKLHMLKRAVRLVISSFGSLDRLSIISFSGSAHRLMALTRMNGQGQAMARKIIDKLVCGQGTCVGEALKKAAKVLEDRREKNPVASIMLLSDGQDDCVGNVSGLNQPSRSSNSTRFGHIEIPVHSSGFGFNKTLMPPNEDAFTKCVGGLLSVVVHDLRIQLGFSSGSAPGEIMAVYSCTARPSLMSCGSVRLGDLYAQEERELLVELKVPTSAIGSHHVMSVRCSYKDPVTQEELIGRDRTLLVPRPHAVRSSDPRIERLRNLFIYTRAVAESRRLMDHGDYTSARHLLASARALVIQSSGGSSSAEDYSRGLEAELTQVHWRRNYQVQIDKQMASAQPLVDENGEPLTPTSAWRAAERLAKMAIMKKSLNRSISDLHGFENARF